jgi:hypothetical protein
MPPPKKAPPTAEQCKAFCTLCNFLPESPECAPAPKQACKCGARQFGQGKTFFYCIFSHKCKYSSEFFKWSLRPLNYFTEKIKHFNVSKHALGPSNNHNMKNQRHSKKQITGRALSSNNSKNNNFYIYIHILYLYY